MGGRDDSKHLSGIAVFACHSTKFEAGLIHLNDLCRSCVLHEVRLFIPLHSINFARISGPDVLLFPCAAGPLSVYAPA